LQANYSRPCRSRERAGITRVSKHRAATVRTTPGVLRVATVRASDGVRVGAWFRAAPCVAVWGLGAVNRPETTTVDTSNGTEPVLATTHGVITAAFSDAIHIADIHVADATDLSPITRFGTRAENVTLSVCPHVAATGRSELTRAPARADDLAGNVVLTRHSSTAISLAGHRTLGSFTTVDRPSAVLRTNASQEARLARHAAVSTVFFSAVDDEGIRGEGRVRVPRCCVVRRAPCIDKG
jgi:hypothetical protein